MRELDLRRLWRRYRLHDTEESIPPGAPANAAMPVSLRATRFDPQDPHFVADPYPLFCYLREYDPIQRGSTGAWVLSRYDDVSAALIDDRLGNAPAEYATVNERNIERYLCASVANNILPYLDPPEHTAPRRLIAQSFQRFVRSHPPPMRKIAERRLAALAARPGFDLLHDFATPYAAEVFCHVLGLDQRQLPELLEWSDWFFYLLTVIPSQQARIQIDHALEQLRIRFADLVKSRLRNPGEDYVSALLRANRESGTIAREQLVDNLMLLFADGVGNVDKGVCAAAALLLRYPGQCERLRHDPALLPRAVDECLRFESPAQFIGRVATGALEIRGQALRKNDVVLLLLGSANRDPEQFEDADEFDIGRYPNPHLSFGRSRHACVGASLVRLEIQAAIEAFVPVASDFELVSNELQWQLRMGHRWLAGLRLSRRD